MPRQVYLLLNTPAFTGHTTGHADLPHHSAPRFRQTRRSCPSASARTNPRVPGPFVRESGFRTNLLCGKAFELPHHPGSKCQIDVAKHGCERRWRVSPIVCKPPPQEWIDLSGDICHRQLGSTAEAQFPDRCPHGLHCRDADGRSEPAEQRVVSVIQDPTGPEAVAEEVKLDVRILASTPSVSAVDNLGLGWMQLEPALCQPCLKLDFEGLRFLLAPAMHQPVICITTPGKVGVRPC